MTTPSGESGFNTSGTWGVSPDPTAGDTVAGLNQRTQDATEAALKNQYRPGGPSVFAGTGAGPLGGVWDGLRTGISLPVSILEALINQLFGTHIEFDDMGSLLSAIEQVPVVGQLITTIEQLTGVNLHTIFDGLDITNPGAVLTAITTAFTQVIQAITTAITGLAADTPLALMFALAQNAAQTVGSVAGAITGVGAEILGILSGLQGQVNVNSAQISALQTATSTPATGSSITFNGSLQSEWTVLTGTAGFNAGALQPVLPFAAYFDIKPATDSHGITFTVVNKIWGTMRGIICADTGFTNYAALEVYTDGYGNDYVRICNGSAPLIAVATPQQYNGAISGGYTYSFDYHQSTNSYVASLNGNPILTWIDSSNLVTHGSTKRTTGLAMAINSGGYGGQGFGVSNFHVYDGTP